MAIDDSSEISARFERMEQRLTKLESERSISHLMYRYAYACDELKDADRIASFFTADAMWEGQGNFAEVGTTTGRDAIRDMFVDNPTMLPFTAHFLTNPIIGVSLDGEKGWGQWHTLEAATLRDERAQVWIAARYDNDFRREGGEWKIAHIRYRDTFVTPYEDGWLKTGYVSLSTLVKRTRL